MCPAVGMLIAAFYINPRIGETFSDEPLGLVLVGAFTNGIGGTQIDLDKFLANKIS